MIYSNDVWRIVLHGVLWIYPNTPFVVVDASLLKTWWNIHTVFFIRCMTLTRVCPQHIKRSQCHKNESNISRSDKIFTILFFVISALYYFSEFSLIGTRSLLYEPIWKMSSSRSNPLQRNGNGGEKDEEDQKPPANESNESSAKSKHSPNVKEQFLDQVCREIILITLNVFLDFLQLNISVLTAISLSGCLMRRLPETATQFDGTRTAMVSLSSTKITLKKNSSQNTSPSPSSSQAS